MMRISIQVYGNLIGTSSVGPSRIEYHVNDGAMIKDILTELNIWESEVKKVMRNGQQVRLNVKIRSRDVLEFY